MKLSRWFLPIFLVTLTATGTFSNAGTGAGARTRAGRKAQALTCKKSFKKKTVKGKARCVKKPKRHHRHRRHR
jgi:hypothetical protein